MVFILKDELTGDRHSSDGTFTNIYFFTKTSERWGGGDRKAFIALYISRYPMADYLICPSTLVSPIYNIMGSGFE